LPARRDGQHDVALPQGRPQVNQERQHEDARSASPPGETPPKSEQAPIGATAVTVFLTITILLLWFGMYALNQARS
jgi:hypothetical protein